jgi:hypothetical protein
VTSRRPGTALSKDFRTHWKDADPDIPILKQAKAEYAKLQQPSRLGEALPFCSDVWSWAPSRGLRPWNPTWIGYGSHRWRPCLSRHLSGRAWWFYGRVGDGNRGPEYQSTRRTERPSSDYGPTVINRLHDFLRLPYRIRDCAQGRRRRGDCHAYRPLATHPLIGRKRGVARADRRDSLMAACSGARVA